MARAMTRARQPAYPYMLTWIQTGKNEQAWAPTTVKSFRSSTMRIRVIGARATATRLLGKDTDLLVKFCQDGRSQFFRTSAMASV